MKPDLAADYSDDEKLYAALKQENEAALMYLYRTVFPSFRNFVLLRNGSEDDAKDCFQQAIQDFYFNVQSGSYIRGYAKISVVLFGYAKNRFFSAIDKKERKVTGAIEGIEPADHSDFALDFEKAELLKYVEHALEKLREPCKTIIEEFYLESKSLKEIGEKLGRSEDSVKTQRYRCINKLKQRLKSLL